MTKEQTLRKFELYMDDTSELSSSEESDLYDKIYQRIATDRPWEGLKSAHAGTTTSNDYIALPADFGFLVQNGNHTESSVESSRPVVFVGSNYDEYAVVSWSDRRQYRDQDNFAYIDSANSRLYFTSSPGSGLAVEFDYHKVPAALDLADSPWFPSQFHDIMYHGMCADDFTIQQSDKAKSYRPEHLKDYQMYMQDMAYWNSQLVQM